MTQSSSILCAEFGTIGNERVYTVKEVAQMLECSERTVRDTIHASDPDDRLPAFSVGRGRERSDYRILESDLLAFIHRQKRKAQRKGRTIAGTRNERLASPSQSSRPSGPGDYASRRAARIAKKGR